MNHYKETTPQGADRRYMMFMLVQPKLRDLLWDCDIQDVKNILAVMYEYDMDHLDARGVE